MVRQTGCRYNNYVTENYQIPAIVYYLFLHCSVAAGDGAPEY